VMIIVRYIYSILCWAFIIVDTAFWGTLSLLSIFISPRGTLSKFCEKWWGRTILRVCRIKVRVTGLENIRSDQVQIFASNHQSFFDIWVLCSIIPVRFGWIIKKELKKIPFLNAHMKIMGYVVIDRSNREKSLASMDQAAEQIRSGSRIVIFPEGTRSRDGQLQPLKKGLFHLCVKTRVPVIPIYIHGTWKIMKPDSLLITSGTIHVTVGNPIPTTGYREDALDQAVLDFQNAMIDLRRDTINLLGENQTSH
jgi:1-acyl-sn-glycerol-3-phosphate acyltransferase